MTRARSFFMWRPKLKKDAREQAALPTVIAAGHLPC
jgi:hypothetical protein